LRSPIRLPAPPLRARANRLGTRKDAINPRHSLVLEIARHNIPPDEEVVAVEMRSKSLAIIWTRSGDQYGEIHHNFDEPGGDPIMRYDNTMRDKGNRPNLTLIIDEIKKGWIGVRVKKVMQISRNEYDIVTQQGKQKLIFHFNSDTGICVRVSDMRTSPHARVLHQYTNNNNNDSPHPANSATDNRRQHTNALDPDLLPKLQHRRNRILEEHIRQGYGTATGTIVHNPRTRAVRQNQIMFLKDANLEDKLQAKRKQSNGA
jgi:hypothetical protein